MREGLSGDERDGAAIAALALAQITFWQLLQQGLLTKHDTIEMLKRSVELSGRLDGAHRVAAEKLAGLLLSVQAYRSPEYADTAPAGYAPQALLKPT
jgi:hypothetical protein